MLDVDSAESRLSVGSLDDLTTAAQAGLFLLAQNNDLQGQIGDLIDQVAHQAHQLEQAASMYDTCWRQRCQAMQEVADVLKENHQLQRDLKLANAKVAKLECDLGLMESRLHNSECALSRFVQASKTHQQSPASQQIKAPRHVPELEATTSSIDTLPVDVAGGERPNQEDVTQDASDTSQNTPIIPARAKQTHPSTRLVDELSEKLSRLAPLEKLYAESVAALEIQTQLVQELQVEQAEERDLIASMRQTIAELKQQVAHLELTATTPPNTQGATVNSILDDSTTAPWDPASGVDPGAPTTHATSSELLTKDATSLDNSLTLDGVQHLVGQLKAHAPLMWSRPVDSVPSLLEGASPPPIHIPRQCHAAIACLQDIWPAGTEADFMELTDWLHLAFRGTGLHRPLRMQNLPEDTVAQVVSRLVPLLQSACHRTVDIALFDRVHYSTDIVLCCHYNT